MDASAAVGLGLAAVGSLVYLSGVAAAYAADAVSGSEAIVQGTGTVAMLGSAIAYIIRSQDKNAERHEKALGEVKAEMAAQGDRVSRDAERITDALSRVHDAIREARP